MEKKVNNIEEYKKKLELMYQSMTNEKSKAEIKKLIDECNMVLGKRINISFNDKTYEAMNRMNGRYEKYDMIKKLIKKDYNNNNFVR